MKTTTESIDIRAKFLADFEMLESRLNGESSTPLHAIRRDAIEQFQALGFPTIRNEEWKYTNVQPFVLNNYSVLASRTTTLTHDDIKPFLFHEEGDFVLVFVNGIFSAELSVVPEVQGGIVVDHFAAAQQRYSTIFRDHFAQHADYRSDAFTALSTAFALDGVFVYVPDNRSLDKTVHVVMIADARQDNVFAQPRNLVVLGKNSSARIVESCGVIGENIGFLNTVTEMFLDENARGEYYKVQDTPGRSSYVGTLQAHQERSSVFTTVTTTLESRFVRNNLNILLNGEGCESHLNGLYLPAGEQHVDNHTLVDHAKPHCESNELYKGILDGKSTGVFNGKVMVRPDAQKTNAFQSNRNILLSDTASINSKPQLEIFADDVKCSHGATIGQLDDAAVFYLRSRGLDEAQAKALMTIAFASDVVETISIDSLREKLEERVARRLYREW
jgi:Fe-S cluster assembly protein SufD